MNDATATTQQSNGQAKGNASEILLGPETSIGDALAAVGAGRITQEQCSEWLAERERVAVAQAEKAAKRNGGNGNSLSVKIGPAGGVVMSGGLVSAAPYKPINLAPNKVLGVILQASKIVAAITAAAVGDERVETKTDDKGKQYSEQFIGVVKVGDATKFKRLLGEAQAMLAK